MCNSNGFGGGSCCWIIILIIILFCCCGGWGGNSCGCGCGNDCGGCGCNDGCGCCAPAAEGPPGPGGGGASAPPRRGPPPPGPIRPPGGEGVGAFPVRWGYVFGAERPAGRFAARDQGQRDRIYMEADRSVSRENSSHSPPWGREEKARGRPVSG